MNRKLLNLLKIIISVFLLWLLLKRIGVIEVYSTLKKSRLDLILLAFLLSVIAFLLQATRLRELIVDQGVKIKLIKVVKFNLMSTFFGIFLPTVIGADVFKMAFLGKYSGRKTASAATVTVDRLSGVYALIMIGFVSTLLGYRFLERQAVIYVFVVFLLGLVALWLLYNQRFWKFFWKTTGSLLKYEWLGVLKKFVKTIQSFQLGSPSIKKALYISFLFYLVAIILSFAIARSFGLEIGLITFFIYVPLISLSGMIPVSISGLGVRETVSVLFFSTLGIAPEYSVLLSLIPFLFKTIFGFVGGIMYLFSKVVER